MSNRLSRSRKDDPEWSRGRKKEILTNSIQVHQSRSMRAHYNLRRSGREWWLCLILVLSMDGLVIGNTKIFILIFIQLITEATSCENCQNMCVCVCVDSIWTTPVNLFSFLLFHPELAFQINLVSSGLHFCNFCIFAFLHFCIFRFLHICIFAFCSGWVHLSSHLIHLIITAGFYHF